MVEQLNYVSAVNAALHRAMRESSDAILFGEDVAKPGGVFGATKGLHLDYGRRVFDTPISEAAILGAAVGAALRGKRPIVEIMWADFALVALDQLVNQAANVRYLSNGAQCAPITVRMQQGHLPGSCAQHSQCLEAYFAHVPGLRVAMPATPEDAFHLLLTAIATNDPVIVIEHRGLYFGPRADVTTEGPVQPIGGAVVRRPGRDVTVVSWGAMLHRTLDAAELAATEGIDVEVIDPRWLSPFDVETVVASVSRTSRAAVVHEANVTGGFGAEVAARISDAAFHDLDAPIARIGLPDVRVPAAPHLQQAVIPSSRSIADAITEFCRR